MTIYWNPDDPVDPDSIDVWHVQDDGTQTDIGPVDLSNVSGMADSFGAVAPDAVRQRCAEYFFEDSTPGSSPSLNKPGAMMIRDLLALNYEKGSPP